MKVEERYSKSDGDEPKHTESVGMDGRDKKHHGRPMDSGHWHRCKVGEPMHERLVAHGRTLLDTERRFHAKNLARERIYEGISLMSHRDAISALDRGGMGIARLNALKSIIDTFVSRLSKDKPMPSFITDGDDWNLKRRARKFRQFIVGQMTETEFDDHSRDALQDGSILGHGFTRIDDNDDSVYAERMLVNDVLFDRRECKYANPRQAIIIKRVARDYLCELFPASMDAIARAPASVRREDDKDVDNSFIGDLDDYVDTWEGIRLPSLRESEDGRRALCIEGATLVSEEWEEPRFPWAMFRLCKPRQGLYGIGFVDGLADLQHCVNRIVRDIQLNLQATGRGHYLVHESNAIAPEMLNGSAPFMLKYKGSSPPQWTAATPYNAAQMSALTMFIQEMYDLSGVSQASATSKSALGAGASGIALDTQYDIDSDRFRLPQSNYARYRLDGAQRYLDAAKRVARRRAENKGKKRSFVAVSWKGRDAIQRLDFSKVDMEEESFRLKIEAVNFIPDTKGGKLSVVEQLLKSGVYPQWIAATLFDEPDLVQANRILLADFNCALMKMEDLEDEDLPIPVPEPYDDLDLELKITNAWYHWMKTDKAPDGVLDRFRQYMDLLTDAIATKKQSAAPPPMPTETVGPDGMPMAPAELPMPGGVPLMPTGPVPPPMTIGAQAPPMVT
jgi:hypothetical protein